jgi:DNA-binding beta-propeller fold protein YncE
MLTDPRGVAVDREGYMYIAATGDNQIEKRQPDGTGFAIFQLQGPGPGQPSQPYSVAVSKKENVLYVTDTGNDRIQKLTLDGRFIECWGGDSCRVKIQLKQPKGVTVGQRENQIYISDTGNHRVVELTSDGEVTKCWAPSNCNEMVNLGEPQGLAADDEGNLYVADAVRNTIHKITSHEWKPWTQFQVPSEQQNAPAVRTFMNPRGVAVYLDEVYIADTQNHRILKLSAGGTLLASWGGPGAGSGPDEFNYPREVAVDDYGNIYVADAGNNRVQRLQR